MNADPAPEALQFTLLVSEKGGAERRQFFRASEITLGRVQGNDLVLPKGNVSKRHARILYREGRFIVADLNSTNGTYVNRRRIAQATIIREDDRVYVGDFVIRIIPTEPLDDEEAPLTPTGLHELTDAYTIKPDSAHTTAAPDPLERRSQPDEIVRPSQAARSSQSTVSPSSTSSAPPSVPRGISEPPVESSSSGQRLGDMASGHRRAVGEAISAVTDELGRPSLSPKADLASRLSEAVEAAVDKMQVDGQIPVGTSAEAVADQAIEELLHLGPLGELLADPAVSMISAARFDELAGTRDGRQQVFPPGFSSAWTFDLAIGRLCLKHGTDADDAVVLDRTLSDGTRLSIVHGKVSPGGPLLTIRKPRRIASTLDDLVRRGAISRAMATFLSHCVAGRLNLLVVGPRDEGAHIVLSALCSSATHERIVTATDFDEVAAHGEGSVRLDVSAYEGEARRLLEIASSIPQTRLAVTLSTPELAAATLEATGSGMSGLLAALHAANLSRGLLRLPADIVAERPGMSLEAAAGWLLSAFDVVIEVTRLRDGRVRVLRIGELSANGAGGVHVSDIFRFVVSRVAAGGAVEGTFTPSGHTPSVVGQLQALGMKVDSSLFVRGPAR